MSYSQLRGPGKDQLAKWKGAIAASRRQQRQRRGRRKTGVATVARAGMVRIPATRTTITEDIDEAGTCDGHSCHDGR